MCSALKFVESARDSRSLLSSLIISLFLSVGRGGWKLLLFKHLFVTLFGELPTKSKEEKKTIYLHIKYVTYV